MTIQAIEGALSQLQATATQAANHSKPIIEPVGFADHLVSAVEQINDVRNHSAKQIEDFTLGKENVSLNDVMVDMQKASLSFQMGIQVRNKLVAAYQEVMSIPV
ncbi:flagellar hook-basal body complex protein FliE [Providencia stuartii]|uniref:flagellar hook-basal body complex protein FliE n=1 Tax=Providencia sp. 2023EL-00965 TaxID=3084975 RepID=UPI0027E7CC9A|nr:flagellar hook-basal body complex protein FliE [Providencia sp. 2023EL-00965]ELR5299188.1 flagellar hook-basal body complex protein FliE [Providencia stuartii]MDW7587358.1 flagellar hook-basal body complex protein FliE [Providencia sp. 2023EL-00965]